MATYFKIHYGLIIASLCFCVKSSDTQCNSSNRFGPNCDFVCHCMNNEQCNSSTGNCPSGCDFDWVGPACQHNNVVPAGSTNDDIVVLRHQSNTPVRRTAFLAVDRDLSTCSRTSYANMSKAIPFWRLWHKTEFKIRNISIITNKESLDYFKNFEVMVEKNSGKYSNAYSSREVCYKHDNSAPTTTHFDVTCSKSIYGNQLRIQLATNGTQLVLCDVRIYGECSNGTFGVSCTEKCSANCKYICNKDDGSCSSCLLGWIGTTCNQACSDGKYGENCATDCSRFCLHDHACSKTDGVCVDGCKPGYRGGKCDLTCTDGEYGENCAKNCSAFCINETACSKKDGICVGGCKPGYRGGNCDLKCADGLYGRNCSFSCSGNCRNNSVCSTIDGNCGQGCKAGYKGVICNEKCMDGTYGQNCTNNCSGNCMNESTCRHTDGYCTPGCKQGWTGDTCHNKCQDGFYGTNCSHNCSKHCLNGKECTHTNGTCKDGCDLGWTGDTCKQECMNGTYGQNCKGNCSGNCMNESTCRHTDGYCTSGCKQGWTGDTCHDKCQNEFYGANCSLKCSTHCLNGTVCTHTNGTCTDGCDPGWTGDTCKEVCSDGEYGENCANNCSGFCMNEAACRKTDGICVDGCKPGYEGRQCDLECMNGTYGQNCTGNCSGNCMNESTCRHTDGYCTSGCKQGWTGDTCHDNFVSEAEKQVGANSIPEGFIVLIISGVAGAVLLLVVVVVSYWKRKAINGKFQALFKRNINNDENVFHNDLYIDEHPRTENMNNVDIYQAMAAQNTDPVYTNTLSLDTQIQSIRESEHSCKTHSDTNAFAPSNDTDYYNFMPAKRTPYAISVSELENVMKTKCLIEGYFKSQFETIPSGLLHPTTVANKPENRHKNRYKNMYPYDHCRVKLKELTGQPDSDYINASFIKGQGKDKAYIASQGPVKENVNDFWRMIWEMDVRMVVMVTNLSENGKMKCIKYWGVEDEVVPYGEINVTTQTENVFAEFTIRDFKLFHQDDVQTTRNVTQLQFTAWPDKDVPNTSSSLLQFWRKVRQNDENKDHVWLVHCSAGVGRTGTFLAMDILFDQGEKMGIVDVYNCVHDLRKQRIKMVQTHGQYIYLHKLLLEILSLPSKPINVDEFMTIYHQLKKKDTKSGKMKLLVEYKSMESEVTWPTALNNQPEASEREEDLDISAEAFRPILSNFVPGSANTIKATYVPSYYDLYEFIIAQRRPQFKMETCRLVFEKKIETVVTFPADQQYDEIFFEESVSGDDPFVVVCQSQKQKEHYAVKEHVLQTGKEKHYFKEIIFNCWSSESVVPEDTNAFLGLLTEVDAQREYLSEYARKSVLFQCWDGVDRSGLVAVLLNVLDRVLADRGVSIPQVIRQLRYNKKELISSFEQYKFCYDVLYCRQESNATYANV